MFDLSCLFLYVIKKDDRHIAVQFASNLTKFGLRHSNIIIHLELCLYFGSLSGLYCLSYYKSVTLHCYYQKYQLHTLLEH